MMRNTYIYIIGCLLLILLPIFSEAQYIADYKKHGDTYFEKNNYYAASVYYQKALKLLPGDIGHYLPYNVYTPDGKKEEKDAENYQYLVYQLGESFRLYKDYKSAEGWYEQALEFDNNRFPLARLWYGVTLRADGEYKEAIKALKQFKNSYSGDDKYIKRAELELVSSEFAIDQMKYPRIAEVKKLSTPVNVEEGSDYAPMKVKDTLYFTSSRAVKNVKPKKHSPYINKIYKVALTNGQKPERVAISDEKYQELAATSLNTSNNHLYFTQWQENKDGELEGNYLLALAELTDNGEVNNTQILGDEVNETGYNSKEASVTSDGKYLIFSSDRPGGEGGYDIWYVALDADGLPTGTATRMGGDVNTSGDEANPYYNSKDQTLYYSSNGKVGMGGFDLYKTKGSFADGNWATSENLGYPVNSSKDDNYYFPDEGKDKFFTSSDRNSVCCLDLYNIELKKLRLIGNVYDEKTRQPINEVETKLMDSISGNTMGELTTSSDGFFHYPLINRRPLKMHFYNKKYGTEDLVITHVELTQVDSVIRRDVYLKLLGKPIRIRNIYYDFDKANLRPESKPALDSLLSLLSENSSWIVEIGSHTDSIGPAEYNEWLSQRRAESVVNYLIDHGIDADRLKAQGYGETQPIAPNSKPNGADNPQGRQLNRRTEFTVIGTIIQNGEETKQLKSNVGNKDQIKVDKSLRLHLSKERRGLRNK